jgi:hypothetical protein
MPVTRENVSKESLIEDIQNDVTQADRLASLENAVLYLLGYREGEGEGAPKETEGEGKPKGAEDKVIDSPKSPELLKR